MSEYGANSPQQQATSAYVQPGDYAQEGGFPQQEQHGNYPQPQAQQPTGGGGIVGKRRNPFASWLGLPIITLGIYSFVWVYKTNKELAEYDSRIKVNPALSLLAFFPGFILVIPPFVAAWRLGSRVAQAQRAAGVPECSPILAFILWMFVASTGVLYLQSEIDKIWDRYPGAEQGQAVPHFG